MQLKKQSIGQYSWMTEENVDVMCYEFGGWMPDGKQEQTVFEFGLKITFSPCIQKNTCKLLDTKLSHSNNYAKQYEK